MDVYTYFRELLGYQRLRYIFGKFLYSHIIDFFLPCIFVEATDLHNVMYFQLPLFASSDVL